MKSPGAGKHASAGGGENVEQDVPYDVPAAQAVCDQFDTQGSIPLPSDRRIGPLFQGQVALIFFLKMQVR